MAKDPFAEFIVTESRSQPGLVSLRPFPRNPGGPNLQEVLTAAGFKEGDIVELRIGRVTRVLPPPGQIMRRPRKRR